MGQPGPGGVWFFDSAKAANHSVLSNDVDWDGDARAAVPEVFSLGGGGTVTLRADGTYYWEFPDTFSGSVTFDYTLVDPTGAEDVATATLWAMPPEPPMPPYPPMGPEPSAGEVADVYFVGDEPLSIDEEDGVLANDTVSSYPFFTSYPAHDKGAMAILINGPTKGRLTYFGADGSFNYTPDPIAPAETALSYYLVRSDGARSDACEVELPPVKADIYHGQDGPKVDGQLELHGAFTVANLNDSDYDGQKDSIDNDGVAPRAAMPAGYEGGEVDLLQFDLHWPNDQNPGNKQIKVEITGGTGVNLWTGKYKNPGEAVALTNNAKEYGKAAFPVNGPLTLWIELTSPSKTVGDVEIKLTYANDKNTTTTSKATGVWFKGTNQSDGDPFNPNNAWQDAAFYTANPVPWPADANGQMMQVFERAAGNQLGQQTNYVISKGLDGVAGNADDLVRTFNATLMQFQLATDGLARVGPMVRIDIGRTMTARTMYLGPVTVHAPSGRSDGLWVPLRA